MLDFSHVSAETGLEMELQQKVGQKHRFNSVNCISGVRCSDKLASLCCWSQGDNADKSTEISSKSRILSEISSKDVGTAPSMASDSCTCFCSASSALDCARVIKTLRGGGGGRVNLIHEISRIVP